MQPTGARPRGPETRRGGRVSHMNLAAASKGAPVAAAVGLIALSALAVNSNRARKKQPEAQTNFALAADRIIAQPGTITGSIGVAHAQVKYGEGL
ncbi:MAG: hypothetical protein FRX49_03176 [Trebouxia sp. A1-2]|nr:MAG: hypothetical protein FRX49_03176 [Trebouxia sp. A1-2]